MDVRFDEIPGKLNILTGKVIGAAIQVHKELGPGLLESVYETCLAHELRLTGIEFERQVPLPVTYRGINLDAGFRADIIVEKQIIIELKSVESLLSVHSAQVMTYLKLTNYRIGILMNFNVDLMKNGIKRIVK